MTREELNQTKQEEIFNEEKREKRKHLVMLFLKITFILILIFLSIFFYITYISTSSLIIKEQRIINEKIPASFDGMKIIQFSDLHYGTTVFQSEVKSLVKQINERNPDLVVFTGDLIDQNYNLKSKERESLITELKKIKASLGKYAIMGEEDGDDFATIFNQSNFTILNNDYELIYKNDNTPILLIGLSSTLKEEINIEKAYSYFQDPTHNSNIYTISLLHEPDSVDQILAQYSTDLFLAGHSHNGTVHIPYFGPLNKKEGAIKYNEPFYQMTNSKLYISSGIGTDEFGFRLFCRPSINFFRLSSE